MYWISNIPVPLEGINIPSDMINSVELQKNKITIHLPNGTYTIEPEVDSQGRAYFDLDWVVNPLPKDIGW